MPFCKKCSAISTLAIVLIVLTVVVAVGATAVFLWWWLVGPENLVTKEMDFSDFTIVEVGYAFEVEIAQSSSYSVNITADEYIYVSRTGENEYVRERTFDYIQVSKTGRYVNNTSQIGLQLSIVNLESRNHNARALRVGVVRSNTRYRCRI